MRWTNIAWQLGRSTEDRSRRQWRPSSVRPSRKCSRDPLSTDDGEQAGEENDRMAQHHLFFFFTFLPTSRLLPPAVLQLVFTFLVSSCRTRRFAFLTQPIKNKHTTITPFFSSFLSPAPPDPQCATSGLPSRADHSMVFPSNRSPLNRRLTSRKILRSALISLLPRPLFARDRLSLRAPWSNRVSPRIPSYVRKVSHMISRHPFH